MKRILIFFFAVLFVLTVGVTAAVGVSADGTTLYVKAGGTGDGSSADAAIGDFAEAMKQAASRTEDVTLQIVGNVPVNVLTEYQEPAHTNKISLTGNGTSGELTVTTADRQHWILGGELSLDHLKISIAGTFLVFRTHFNPITFGDGMEMPEGNTQKGVWIMCVDGADNFNYDSATSEYHGNSIITINSGSFGEVQVFGRNTGTPADTFEKASMILNGGTIFNLTVLRNRQALTDDVTVCLNGGVVQKFLCFTHLASEKTAGVKPGSKFTMIVTDKFNIADSFFAEQTDDALFKGMVGSTLNTASAAEYLESDKYGEYLCYAEAGVYDALVSSGKVNVDSYDKFEKIGSGTGLSLFPTLDKTPVVIPEPEPETEPPVTEKDTEQQTEKATEKATEKVTEKATEKVTEKATEKATEKVTEKATEKVSGGTDEGGVDVGAIIAIVAAVVVAAAVVTVLLIKKKKAK